LLALLALIFAGMGAVDAIQLGSAPTNTPSTPEIMALSRRARRALVEPLLSVLLAVPAALVSVPGLSGLLVLISLAVLWACLAPLSRLAVADAGLRAARDRLVRASLARWLLLILPLLAGPSPLALLSILGAGLTWHTKAAAARLLSHQLMLPPPRKRAPAAPAFLPPPAPALPAPEEALAPPPIAALPCPSCGAEAPLDSPFCPGCGLLFASRVPPALGTLAAFGYRVLRPLGSGGMSAVYLAYEPRAESWCCVKTIVSVDQGGDVVWRRDATQSLAREAAILVELDHPQVARIRDYLDDPARPCMVLDFVPGVSLEQLLAAGRPALSGRAALAWGCDVAGVLAHLAGRAEPIAHGDIKPANLLHAGPRRRLTVVDFGSAARLSLAGPALQPHAALGTPGYAAPEQYRGLIGPASDVYGLGATLYHLLSGDDPTRHPTQFPALAALPAAIRDTLAPALAADPALRPAAHRLAAELRRLV
jgi:hypothetical protein